MFVGCVDGAEARILSSTSVKALQAFVQANPTLARNAVASAPYPAYLDRFDRYGWGLYGFGGHGDGNWMQYAAKYDGKKERKDPNEDMQFLIDNKFRFEGFLDPAIFDFSDGIIKNTEAEWITKKAADGGLPFSFRVYGDPGGAHWSGRRFAEYIEQPAPFLTSGWHGYSLGTKSTPHLTWYDRDIQRYMAVKTMDMMRRYVDNPMNLGWMHPAGELAHDSWYDMHDDYSPTATQNWHEYLQKQGIDLPTVTRMYGLKQSVFTDWDQVPVPEFATFAGLNGQVLDLGGKWYARLENDGTQKVDDAWYAQAPAQQFRGIREQWWAEKPAAPAWKLVHAPGGDDLYDVLPAPDSASSWFRRSFALTPTQLAAGKIYLYWFPISNSGLHIGQHAMYNEIYLNGVKAGEIGSWGAIDVTDKLQAGENAIALHLLGRQWNGRLYLSTTPPKIFPYLGDDMNRLWVIWKTWHVDAKFSAWRDILDGMRQVDPNRPIKFMAPLGFGSQRWLTLAHDYGGFGHFTGEGIWFFPWYKRYGFLYDVPGSSETAGPANSLDDQFDSYRRTFLEGVNAHDPVFLAQWYTRQPELRKFWLTHNPILKRMGKQDLDATQQVLLYRGTKMDEGLLEEAPYPTVGVSREVQSPWNWDIGRGTLQTIGQSYLYLDDMGVKDGKMYGYPVMIDGGDELMPAESIKGIADWVRAGGTFVTLPFTGRSTYTETDAWKIRELTGCEIGKLRKPGQGQITIGANQSVFTTLAGKTFPDNGHSTDWQGGEHNLLSVELKPGAECEVLATFENGTPAIVRHKLGNGYVIALGTAFWRDSKDVRGVWWPSKLETDFMADLLHGVGFPDAR
ncbi:MAG TPA: hypothetical protein VGM23_18410, partial [Armatimonadota bacterium]